MTYDDMRALTAELRDHPGKGGGKDPADKEAFNQLVGKFLEQLVPVQDNAPHSREDVEEIDAYVDAKDDEDARRAAWDAAAPNPKVAIALRQALAVDKVTFPPDHPAIQKAWEALRPVQSLIIIWDRNKLPSRKELAYDQAVLSGAIQA